MVSTWHPLAVAWGIVGMYVLVAVEVTSLARAPAVAAGLAGIHMLSYVLLALVTVHFLTAGTDASDLLPTTSAVLIGVATVFGCRHAPHLAHGAQAASRHRCRPVTWSGYQPVAWPGDRAGPPIGPLERAASLRRLGDERFDVLVVGGGITGAGVALDAASRGLRTALVERDDFASGTSSKSSKLVHGGLRYLQQREVRLVYESALRTATGARERAAPRAHPARSSSRC